MTPDQWLAWLPAFVAWVGIAVPYYERRADRKREDRRHCCGSCCR